MAEGARNIADGQKRGELGTDVPPELGAAMVLGAVRGAINQAVSEPATINIDQLNAKSGPSWAPGCSSLHRSFHVR